jgi:hypothetical protein
MHAIVPSHVGSGNLESGVAAARYHRWRTPESRFFLFAANSHIGCCTNIHLAKASSANRQVFVINSGAYVTKVACNFYELLGWRLVDPTPSAMCICLLLHVHPRVVARSATDVGSSQATPR